jgi:hypothetical protein
MLVLKEGEVCPYSSSCHYNKMGSCQGSRSDRQYVFTCVYVENGIIQEGGVIRNPYDITGKMQVIVE